MLSENSRAAKFAVDGDKTFISINGTVGWIFPNGILKIDADKLRDIAALDLDGLVSKENELEETKDFLLVDEREKKMVRRYRKGKTSIFINPKLLEHFQNYTLFQKDSPLGIIVVAERFKNDSTHSVCGVVCPMRDTGSWAARYADYF